MGCSVESTESNTASQFEIEADGGITHCQARDAAVAGSGMRYDTAAPAVQDLWQPLVGGTTAVSSRRRL